MKPHPEHWIERARPLFIGFEELFNFFSFTAADETVRWELLFKGCKLHHLKSAAMVFFFRNREEDLENPDLRASRYFLFKNKQTEQNKLKVAEKKYGYTLADLHAYKHLMKPPRMPDRMVQERPEMAHTYDQISKLVECEEYVQQTENHFATKPGKPWGRRKSAEEGSSSSDVPSEVSPHASSSPSEGCTGNAPADAVDESCVKCLGYYLALDRCVREVSKRDEKNRVYKHTRLHACKPHWVNCGPALGEEPDLSVV